MVCLSIFYGVFIVNSEHISHLFLVFRFEQVNVNWVNTPLLRMLNPK